MIDEIWKAIPNTNGFYSVSNYGRIYAARKNKIMSTPVHSGGYQKAYMSINGVRTSQYVHRLVAMMFIGDIYDQVDHIDGNKLNNHVSNLRLCTHRENQIFKTGKKFSNTFLTDGGLWSARIQINEKSYNLGLYDTEREAHAAYLGAVFVTEKRFDNLTKEKETNQ